MRTTPYLQQLHFEGFLRFLQVELGLTEEQIQDALKELDGPTAVVASRAYIQAYDHLGRHVSQLLTARQIMAFATQNETVLTDDEDRFFFARSFLETATLTATERAQIIAAMPEDYQPNLIRWFGSDRTNPV